ncbi:hypothetical protein WME73_05815 [Sorangium sp. So ce302]|uniref:hypothetical protein n=1 Tax=Sorangium sp. So ce302 TaxID=3133297 RepID=UPI003F5E06A4
MGTVFLARDTKLGRLIAVKILVESRAGSRSKVHAAAPADARGWFNHCGYCTHRTCSPL